VRAQRSYSFVKVACRRGDEGGYDVNTPEAAYRGEVDAERYHARGTI